MEKALKERVREHYIPLLEKFREELLAKHPAEAYRGLPEIFLPAWGKIYERAPLRMAVVGKETRGWGDDLSVTLEKIEKRDWDYVFDVSKFQNLDYTAWGTTRYHFWGFAMFFLAKLYGVKDWGKLKLKEHADILNHFVWGNVCAVETWESATVDGGMGKETWAEAFDASRPFNTFAHLQTLFAPQVTLVMCSRALCDGYLAACAPTLVWERDNVRLFKVGDAYVFNLPHPQAMQWQGGEYAAETYVKTIREALHELGLFQALPSFVDAYNTQATQILHYLTVCAKQVANSREAIRLIAEELNRHGATMSAIYLVDILNAAGHRTQRGGKYTGTPPGIYETISKAYTYYDSNGESSAADKIAKAFTRPDGSYAYE